MNQPPGTAIASLALGLASLVVLIIAGLPAILCGHLALAEIRSGRATSGKGLALTGLILGYLSILTTILALVFHPEVLDIFKRVPRPPSSSPLPGPGPDMNPAPLKPTPPTKTPPATDPATANIPDTPVAGTLKGSAFTPDSVSLQNGILTFRQGRELYSDRQILVFLFPKLDEEIAGKKYLIRTNAGPSSPHVQLRWKEGAGTKTSAMSGGYVLRLEFEKALGRRVPGRIYLELPKEHDTRIAGMFEADTEGSVGPRPKRP